MMNNKLSSLRAHMAQHGLGALIVPTNDPHFSEYVAAHFKCREWLTGFTGSAGTAVVTPTAAALFTDSRYFLQAEQQLAGSGFELKKEGLPNSETLAQYLKRHLDKGSVGVDGKLYAVAAFEKLQQELSPLALTAVDDPFAALWPDRPPMPSTQAFLMDVALTGATIEEKFAALQKKLNAPEDSLYVVGALDEVAWLLNLRGHDVAYTPVNIAYAIVDFESEAITLAMNFDKMSKAVIRQLQEQRVQIVQYKDFELMLAQLSDSRKVIYNPNKTSIATQKIVQQHNQSGITKEATPFGFGAISQLKAVKSAAEVAGTRRAMLADGVAWLRFWKWLEENVDSGALTELSAGEKMHELRALHPDFIEDSFAPIVGYKEHGAIVHYSASPASSIALGRDTFMLVDTGGHYAYGTTDITRTLHLGAPSEQEKTDYTLVLKGHLQLSAAKFPHGTRGAQLDMLARQPLMQRHLTYLHGTGHGVGHCLCVHEGPQSIRLEENPTVIEPSMITSCEPGIYRAGRYGIRLENLVLTVPSGESEFGSFLQFEPLTLCPFDTKALNPALLHPEDIAYLNGYHRQVYALLSPLLSAEEQHFLREKTKEIG
ncbi:MAG: aminopeptidase P family protein [Prevotellaceae bacterium]|jgi:Xaa-Pro aminopeptidase|nr:aminopeptidase P family protein [Prevotellaceae bacterium]